MLCAYNQVQYGNCNIDAYGTLLLSLAYNIIYDALKKSV